MRRTLQIKVFGIAALMLSAAPWTIAQAQAVAPDGTDQSSEPATTEDVVVTGSRVATNGNDQPTPVTVVAIEQIRQSNPQTVAEQLNELPQFAGSQGQTSGAGAGGANGGNPASQGNVLNLRNFGFVRNLVLFDGHRVAPNSPNGTVDVDMIPQLLLKRVDVVTGGASAVYGSDAVTGVVNFVTDTTFNGLKAQAQAGISSRGDGGTQDIGIALGHAFGDRAHILLSAQYRNDEGIAHRSDRDWGRQRYQIGTVNTVNGVTNQRFVTRAARTGASFGGTINALTGTIGTNPLAGQYFITPGVLTPENRGDFVNTNVAGGGSGSYFDPSLKGELRLAQYFGRFDYELADGLNFYTRGAYTDNRNAGYSVYSPTYLVSTASNVHPISVDNPYLPAQYAAQLRASSQTLPSGLQVFGINKVFGLSNQEQYRQYTEAFTKNLSVDTGFNGTFGNNWKWELSYIYSRNNQKVRQNFGINGRKLAASLDAVQTASGVQCYVTTILATLPAALQDVYRGCVPMSTIFGPTITQAEADYVFDPLEVETRIRSHDVEGFVSGSPFETWAGPVNVAVSGQYRKLSYSVYTPHIQATQANPLDCTGLRLVTGRFACTPFSTEFFQGESLSRPRTSIEVKEGAVEASVPLLRDFVLAQDLSVSGAYRYTDYSTSGGISSWKGGVDWNVTDDLHLRATWSRDIRAPTLHELFAPQSVGSYNGTDVLLNVALDGAAGRPNPAGVVTSGNETLRPEKADTFTAGFSYKPSFVPGFSISFDYFNIRVRDAILSLNGQDIGTQNDCITSGGSSATCQLIVRATGNCCTTTGLSNPIVRAFSRPINIGRQFTRGADMELNYATRLFDRAFSLRGLVSYQPKNVFVDGITGVQTNVAGAASSNFNGFGHAKWRGQAQANVELTDNFRFSISERWRGKLNYYPTFKGTGAPAFALTGAPGLPDKFYTNLNFAFRTGPGEFFVNVQNAFDVDPGPYAGFNSALPGNNGVAPGDDPVGRYFTAGVRIKM